MFEGRGVVPVGRRSWFRAAAGLLATLLGAGPAAALDFDVFDTGITGSLRTQLSIGAAMRTQGRKIDLMGKLNLPGQEQFCEDKDPDGPGGPQAAPGINCLTVAGNQAFLDLPGYPSVNFDNGNMNYDKGDLVNAAYKIAPRLQLTWENFGFDLSAMYFHDEVNSNFTEFHQNNRPDNNGFQRRETPRRQDAEEQVGSALHLLDAYVSASLPIPGERELTAKLGNQIISLGTTTLLVFNGLNGVNPPDANIRFLPGSDVREVFQRIPLLSLGTNVTESVSVETFYALGWKPIETPPIGSFFSTNDVVGTGGGYVVALAGKYREDPDNLVSGGATGTDRTQGNAGQLSDAGRTLYVNPAREPKDGGEYGLTLSYFAEWLNNTSFALTYLNLHSRFPLINFVASQLGCAHDSANAAEAAVDCEGFLTAANGHGTMDTTGDGEPDGEEVAPIDTVRLFLSYPEDIQALGFSFSTSLGAVAWTGELVYRANQPLQVDVTDVGFAALQPIFPAETIAIQPLPAPAPPVNIPGRRVAAPDYVETRYRRHTVRPGQDVLGYERFKTLNWNTSFLFLAGASENPFGADQLTSLLEIGAFQILDLPPLDQLQLGAPGVPFHHSPGVDGTGTSTGANQDRLNPSYQEGGFGTEFSWGYRMLNQLTFEEVFSGVKLQPQAVFFHDVDGKSPLPSGEFVKGRKQATAGLAVTYHSSWSGALRYNWFFGGGLGNGLTDRDNVTLHLSYDF
jgi:hypothetical protein